MRAVRQALMLHFADARLDVRQQRIRLAAARGVHRRADTVPAWRSWSLCGACLIPSWCELTCHLTRSGLLDQNTVDDIRAIERPVRLGTDDSVMTPMLWDILWSDPTDDDSVVGIHSNVQRGGSGACGFLSFLRSIKVPLTQLACDRQQHLQVRPGQSERLLCHGGPETGHPSARVRPRRVSVLRELPFDHSLFSHELLRPLRQRRRVSGDLNRSTAGERRILFPRRCVLCPLFVLGLTAPRWLRS